ncbi:hypothetical protein PROFUN_03186 [Planoprotostelium fungivorum]|uniref:Vesicle tethering protein Uso1/P115-like head domain-containing protein n=1 Tax=Planoprotostelium fungivorum TaxID=1890364 RepID=A0A2P6NWZ2_9EUKA|nr:hypothetical protein PROFUN_03186 [Planoprotostelium fungivorum]
MSWLSSVGGMLARAGAPEVKEPSDLLLKNLEQSNHREDRRRNLIGLKNNASVDSVQRKIIGSSLGSFVNVCKIDREDTDIIKDVLDILTTLMSTSSGQIKVIPTGTPERDNIDGFLKDPKHLTVILELLDDRDSGIRFQITQIIQILLMNNRNSLQQHIMSINMGLARLMDLLKDSREFIRNEALLILLELCKSGSQELQKILAFEGAFDALFAIIREEGGTEGGIVVQDCLQLINGLLRDNVSNQNYFRETSCIARLTGLLKISSSDAWILTDDKTNILLLTLKTISLLVCGDNPNTHTNQSVMLKNNIINVVLPLAIGRVNSVILRTRALYTLGDLLYGNRENCTLFSSLHIHIEDLNPVLMTSNNSVIIHSNPKIQPALSRLLAVVLRASDVRERIAAVRVFKCFLYENDEGQLTLASTLTPSSLDEAINADTTKSSIGTQLIHHLLSWEDDQEALPFRSWFSCTILMYILRDEPSSKELVLKIPLEIPKSGVPMVTLLTKCTKNLVLCCQLSSSQNQSGNSMTNAPNRAPVKNHLVQIALLRLLCIWMDNCSYAVRIFLSAPNNLPFLVETIITSSSSSSDTTDDHVIHTDGLCCLLLGLCLKLCEDDANSPVQPQFSREAIHNIIMQRIGLDRFSSKLDSLKKSDQFIRAEAGGADHNLSLDDVDEKEIKSYSAMETLQQQLSHVYYYDYDFTLFYKATADKIQKQLRSPKHFGKKTKGNNKQKENRSTEPKVPVSTSDSGVSLPKTVENSSNSDAVLGSYKELIRAQDQELESWKSRNRELEEKIARLESQKGDNRNSDENPPNSQNDTTVKLLEEKDQTITRLQQQVSQLEEKLEEKQANNTAPSEEEFLGLTQAYSQLEMMIVDLQKENRELKLKSQNTASPLQQAEKDRHIARLEQQLKDMQTQHQKENRAKLAELQFTSLEKEQEDLLAELANLQMENEQLKGE